jgi:hypothetical protein
MVADDLLEAVGGVQGESDCHSRRKFHFIG